MKKLIITSAILFLTAASFAQTAPQKKLPPKLTFTLTDKQFMRLDSAIAGAVQRIDSKAETIWFMTSFDVLYKQMQGQLVADTTKKK